ncbi:MAG: hypothetical protein C0593_00960, partial [Marinilabiliales bacterium]
MKIKLYSLKAGKAELSQEITVKKGRITDPSQIQIAIASYQDLCNSKSLIEYTYDIGLIPLSYEKINTIMDYQFLLEERKDRKDAQVAYARLNFLQRIRFSTQFNNCWLQKNENVMWLINIAVAALAV